MNDFARQFLNEDWEGLVDAPRAYLGAFGKHPGWNDHLDDIGLVTHSLVDARRVIYASGIAHQIENATWDKIGAEKQLPWFEHVLHWRRPGETLTGLMWSSSDGKGRTLYPMIIAAHCIGQPFDWVAQELLPTLEQTAAKCRATRSAGDVITAINAAQQLLRARTAGVSSARPTGADLGLAAWGAHFGREETTLRRVYHHLRGQLAIFAPGSVEWCSDQLPVRSRIMRLPIAPGAKPAQSLYAWTAFLATQLDPAVPILAITPAGQNWVDVIVGEPTPADFFLLRALPTAAPLVSDIPYQLDGDMQAYVTRHLAEISHGALPSTSFFNRAAVEANQTAAAKWLARFRPSARPGFFSRLLRTRVPT